MKKYILGLIATFILGVSAVCAASAYTMNSLPFLIGAWRGRTNNLLFRIDNTSIDGKEIVWMGDFKGSSKEGSGLFRVKDKDVTVEYKLDWKAIGNATELTIDNGLKVYKEGAGLSMEKEEIHQESIGGVYLGMTPEEVSKLYGKPDTITTFSTTSERWNYAKDKWQVVFVNGKAVTIRFYDEGPKHFDKSGFSCKQSKEDYTLKYMGVERAGYKRITVGKGEYIWIGEESGYGLPHWVELSIYPN